MKKMILLCTAMMCAGQLYGMEQPSLQHLPREIIINIVTKYENRDDAIKALKALSVTNKGLHAILNMQDQKGFWELADVLAKKYPYTPIPQEIKDSGLNMHQRVTVAIAQRLNMAMGKELPIKLLLEKWYSKGATEFEETYHEFQAH